VPDAPTVSLRTFRPEDAAAVHAWFNAREVTENLVELRDGFSEDDAAGWVRRAAVAEGPDRKWAVTVSGSDRAVGFTALYGLFGQSAPELGAMIGDPAGWGKGVGREAERLTIERAFDEFGAHRILGLIPSTNERAKGVVRRLGFRHEGLMRRHVRRGHTLIDVEVWGLLPEEFRAATAEPG